ncbi:unnamed protein product, partial [Laminaria digitata]
PKHSPNYRTVKLTFASSSCHDLFFNLIQVEEGDGSSRLGYTSSAALSAGEGDILRASANPTTLVDLTLPAKGAASSLSWSCEVVVDSTAARVVNVSLPRLGQIICMI